MYNNGEYQRNMKLLSNISKRRKSVSTPYSRIPYCFAFDLRQLNLVILIICFLFFFHQKWCFFKIRNKKCYKTAIWGHVVYDFDRSNNNRNGTSRIISLNWKHTHAKPNFNREQILNDLFTCWSHHAYKVSQFWDATTLDISTDATSYILTYSIL